MTQLIAFLRGINVGGRRLSMEALRGAFAGMGFTDAQTLIASGNVLFSGQHDERLIPHIEAGLRKSFGFDVTTIIRSVDDLQAMVDADPFGGIRSGEDVKCYVFFLGENSLPIANFPLKIEGDYEIVRQTSREIYALANRMPNGRFGAGLDKLTTVLGAQNTNRNWNTVLRLIDKAKA